MRHEVVVITGASAGVGRATAHEFGHHQTKVALLARGIDGLEATRLEVEAAGGEALVIPVDVSDAEKVESAAARVIDEWGHIDVWINNAMCSVFSPVIEMAAEEYRRVTEVTYLGYVYGTLAALRRMRGQGHGVIVQVGSALAYRSIPLQSAYCASKHAIVGFTDSLRSELLHEGSNIRVTCVHMPALNTPQFGWVKSRLPRKPQPVPPIYQPEVAAAAIFYAAHHPHREYWVGWPTYKAIIGQKIAPGFLDHYLGRFGYEAQQYDGEADPNHANNLLRPIPGDHGTHGAFDERATYNNKFQFWFDRNLSLLKWGVVALGAAVLGISISDRVRRGGAGAEPQLSQLEEQAPRRIRRITRKHEATLAYAEQKHAA